jgi:hypothetical protein
MLRTNSQGQMDRNPKWRFNDIVFYEECSVCGVKVEWQAERQEDNDQNHFRTALFEKGWKKRGFLFPQWVCDRH